MHVIGVQLDIAWEDKNANFAKVQALLAASRPKAGSLVVLPEMFATGFSMDVAAVTEAANGATERFLAETAREFGVHMLAGLATAVEGGKGRNDAVLFDPDGRQAVRYTKMHPFSYAQEQEHYLPGGGVVTFGWSGFTAAPFVCYDLRFPEVFRAAVRRGANLLVVIANWPQAREGHWRTLLAARAIENQAYVVGVNRCGRSPKLTYGGASLIVDPRGQILADAGSDERTVQADIDLHYLTSYRREFPALQDMRGEFNA